MIRHLRAAPSGGGLFPIKIYLVSLNIEGLEQGIYHYSAKENQLEFIKAGFSGVHLTETTAQPEIFNRAAGVVILTAVLDRTLFKYEERGYRFILLETGHIVQNILLVVAGLGLGAVVISGFIDDEFDRILNLDGFNESTIYMIAIGRVQEGKQ